MRSDQFASTTLVWLEHCFNESRRRRCRSMLHQEAKERERFPARADGPGVASQRQRVDIELKIIKSERLADADKVAATANALKFRRNFAGVDGARSTSSTPA